MSVRVQDQDRTSTGRFVAGKSGNPSGRPKSPNAVLREALSKDGEKVIAVVVKFALGGDMVAARMILDRIVPQLKPTAEPVDLFFPAPATPLAVAEALLDSVSRGGIAPDVASQLISATAQFSKIVEIEELRSRLEALERATKISASKNKYHG